LKERLKRDRTDDDTPGAQVTQPGRKEPETTEYGRAKGAGAGRQGPEQPQDESHADRSDAEGKKGNRAHHRPDKEFGNREANSTSANRGRRKSEKNREGGSASKRTTIPRGGGATVADNGESRAMAIKVKQQELAYSNWERPKTRKNQAALLFLMTHPGGVPPTPHSPKLGELGRGDCSAGTRGEKTNRCARLRARRKTWNFC